MSGTNPAEVVAYVSPIDFRIAQSPPIINNIEDVNFAITDLYAFAQQVIRTLVDTLGIGPQTPASQIALDGNPTTITCGDQNRFYCTAAQTIQPGMAVNFSDNGGGKLVANPATDAATNIVQGFCSHPNVINAGSVGEFMIGTGIVRINGLILGSLYFASSTPGFISNTPTGTQQRVGWAVTTQYLFFNV